MNDMHFIILYDIYTYHYQFATFFFTIIYDAMDFLLT